MDSNIKLIIDFDSTFIQLEALDELARISLENNPEKGRILKSIENITAMGMDGTFTFTESLAARMAQLSIHKKHIDEVTALLEKHVSRSFRRNKEFILKNAAHIYIISGGFQDYISPITKKFGIDSTHVLSNSFIFNTNNQVTGYDTTNPLAHENGKAVALKKLKLDGKIIVVGDGYTDYEAKEKGAAHKFIAFTENITRENSLQRADKVVKNFDELINYLHTTINSV